MAMTESGRRCTSWAGRSPELAALTLGAPSLGDRRASAPVDHYHAFLDRSSSSCGGRRPGRDGAAGAGRAVAAVALIGVVGWNLATQPAAVVADGGWPPAERAGERIVATPRRPARLRRLPDIKGPDAYVFPVMRSGVTVVADGEALPAGGVVIVLCEDTWVHLIGAPCGGPAEDPGAATSAAAAGRRVTLLERFSPASGRLLSLYRVEAD
jgi:hypothetical protein